MPTKKQVQPKTHAVKNKAAVAVRRKKILAAAIAGESIRDAAIAAGLSPKTAGSQATAILKEPEVIHSFQELLNNIIPNERLAKKYSDIMEATKVISANVIMPGGGGMADAHSMTKDFIDVPDYPTQLRAADSVSKLKGLIVDKHDFEGLKPILLVESASTRTPTA